MRKYLLSLFFTFSIISLFAQDLDVQADIGNPSNVINDGFIDLKVTGGTEPYTYQWSNQSTPLTSPRAEGLVEGIPYNVLVTDATGASTTRSYTVKAEAITEHFNGTFAPIVAAMGGVLFWDPFSAIGVYDPVVYADLKNVPTPGWEANIEERFVLKQWLVSEGARVNRGDRIAIISKSKGEDIEAVANASGTLKHLTAEGEVIYNFENKEHVIEEGAHNLAQIIYDEKIPLTHPNGDPQTKNIPFIVVWLLLGALFFTLRMGFINIRGFRHALQLARGKYDDPNAPGQVTHFQALATLSLIHI